MSASYRNRQHGIGSDGPTQQLELRDLRLIVAVHAEGSLTRAGARLNVTQPALSRHLITLERRLGTKLFARTAARMQATPAGELLLRHAREVLDRVAATEADLRQLNKSPRRCLRVGTDCYTGYHWLPGILNRFTARHPDVQVEIAFEAGRKPMSQLRSGAIDVALLTEGPPRAGFSITRLFVDEYVAVVPPAHPWATKKSFIEAADLNGVRVLLVSPPDQNTVVRRFIKPAGAKPSLVADVQLIGAVAALAESEFGVGMVPGWIIAPEVRAGRLVPLRLGRNGLKRQWVAAVASPNARDRWLQDLLQSLAKEGPAMSLHPSAI